jgi:hypothetical protein
MLKFSFFLAFLLISFAMPLYSQNIAKSHIQANVPDAKDFDRILLRDLRAKFCGSEKCKLSYELLRKVATQAGIAYPKFYVWVVAKDGSKQQNGAVRLAAIDKDHFEITDYLPAERIRNAPEQVSAIFPAALMKGIIERAAKDGG